MNQVDQNINKDMLDSDLIDVESLDFSDGQTWLVTSTSDSNQRVDIVDWNLSCDWPVSEDNVCVKMEKVLYGLLDNILKSDFVSLPDKHKFDSRTYVKPKKRIQRPSIHNLVDVVSNPPSMSPQNSLNTTGTKYLTYNKYSMPLGPISPMLRLKTFNVDTNSDNSYAVKEYAMKRRSLVQDDDPQLEDIDITLVSETSSRPSMDHMPSKPINIDLSQPAHNLHNTFNKGLSNMMNERSSLNMYQSGDSLMRMSPPSLVSSLLMESSGTFNPESIESRKSMPSHRDSGLPTSGRDSIDPMMTSMTLSILDEKDMSTSFLSQTTYPDNDSLMDSLPPSLVSSVNSSYVITNNTSKPKPEHTDTNIFSSTTFTHLEHSEKLLSARPRYQLFNSFTKRDSSIRNSESYTKSREEACQIDTSKVLNENSDKKDSMKAVQKPNPEMGETITLHYSNNKFRRDNDAEKENFERDDAFYKDMGMQKPEEIGKNSLNVTLGKQELNEIIQARQKLSLARKGLPSEPDKPLPNQVDTSPIKTIQLPNQTITVPRQSMENASELLSRRRALTTNGLDNHEEQARELPKRSATFKKVSPKQTPMDSTVVYVKADENQMIDINSATLNLIDASERILPDEDWGLQERAMVGSCESTDTATFSSSSPPDSVPDTNHTHSLSYGSMMPPTAIARKTGLPTSKLRQYSSHRELSRIPGGNANVAPRGSNSRTMIRRGVYASNPALSPTAPAPPATPAPPAPSESYTIAVAPQAFLKSEEKSRPVMAAPPALVRQGTETLRRERPQSQLVAPKELRLSGVPTAGGLPVSMRNHQIPPPTTRPYSIAGATQLRVTRPASGPVQKPAPVVTPAPVVEQPRPMSSTEARGSALPRPSRLPAPRRSIRPPSVYSVAPTADIDHY